MHDRQSLSTDADVNAASAAPPVARTVEDSIGCKWSLAVIGAVRRGVCRPGELEHSIEGLSKKVLNERLAKLVRYGILDKRSYAELPPRVEYRITHFGEKVCGLLDGIEVMHMIRTGQLRGLEDPVSSAVNQF